MFVNALSVRRQIIGVQRRFFGYREGSGIIPKIEAVRVEEKNRESNGGWAGGAPRKARSGLLRLIDFGERCLSGGARPRNMLALEFALSLSLSVTPPVRHRLQHSVQCKLALTVYLVQYALELTSPLSLQLLR